MDNAEIKEIIRECVEIELNVSDLYLEFFKKFEEDSAFWWELVIEEKTHASLLESVLSIEEFSDKIKDYLPNDINELKQINSMIKEKIEFFRNLSEPDRKTAFETAMYLETSSGEVHLQGILGSKDSNSVIELFKKLASDDKDHYDRIVKYAKEKDII